LIQGKCVHSILHLPIVSEAASFTFLYDVGEIWNRKETRLPVFRQRSIVSSHIFSKTSEGEELESGVGRTTWFPSQENSRLMTHEPFSRRALPTSFEVISATLGIIKSNRLNALDSITCRFSLRPNSIMSAANGHTTTSFLSSSMAPRI
jgi:hypothetical protein